MLVCSKGVASLQTNNFHKTWTDNQKLVRGVSRGKKQFPVQWAMFKGAKSWSLKVIKVWTFECLIIKKCALQWFIQYFSGIQGT